MDQLKAYVKFIYILGVMTYPQTAYVPGVLTAILSKVFE